MIYIVTSGVYDSYKIEAVFSTKERAEEYLETLPLEDIPGIEEWEVDEE